jgi:hypothetical protein
MLPYTDFSFRLKAGIVGVESNYILIRISLIPVLLVFYRYVYALPFIFLTPSTTPKADLA